MKKYRNIMKKYRLTENMLRDIIRESVRNAVNESVFDYDDYDDDIFDVGPTDKYRLTWCIREETGWCEYKDITEGQDEFKSKDDALNMARQLLNNSPRNAYAVTFKIERLIKTLSDDRFETIYDWSGCYVREILEGSDRVTPIGENAIRNNKQLRESLSLIERMN